MLDFFDFNKRYEDRKFKDVPKTARKYPIDHFAIIVGIGFLFVVLLGNIFSANTTVFSKTVKDNVSMYNEVQSISHFPAWVEKKLGEVENKNVKASWCNADMFNGRSSNSISRSEHGWTYTCTRIPVYKEVKIGDDTYTAISKDENGNNVYDYKITKISLKLAARDMLDQPFRFILRPFPGTEMRQNLDFAHNSNITVFSGFNTLGILIVLFVVVYLFAYYFIDYVIILRKIIKGLEKGVKKTGTVVGDVLGIKPGAYSNYFEDDEEEYEEPIITKPKPAVKPEKTEPVIKPEKPKDDYKPRSIFDSPEDDENDEE